MQKKKFSESCQTGGRCHFESKSFSCRFFFQIGLFHQDFLREKMQEREEEGGQPNLKTFQKICRIWTQANNHEASWIINWILRNPINTHFLRAVYSFSFDCIDLFSTQLREPLIVSSFLYCMYYDKILIYRIKVFTALLMFFKFPVTWFLKNKFSTFAKIRYHLFKLWQHIFF